MSTEVERVLAEVLAAHEFNWNSGWCECRWGAGDISVAFTDHSAHVAAEQAKVLGEWAQSGEVVERAFTAVRPFVPEQNWNRDAATAVAARAVLTAIFG